MQASTLAQVEEEEPEVAREDLFLPIKKAQEMGATPEQILIGIASKHPSYARRIQQAREMGGTDKQIFKAISRRPKFTEAPVRKTGRLAAQSAIGLAEAATLPYNLAATGIKAFSDVATPQIMRQNLQEHRNHLLEMKMLGFWDEDDQKMYDGITHLLDNPEEMEKFIPEGVKPFDVGSLAERGFEKLGVDIQPEDFSEEAIRWASFMKDPKKLFKAATTFYKSPQQAADALKALKPTLSEMARGIGAATGMEIAKEGGFGPMGSIAATVAGDLIAGGTVGAGKASLRLGKTIAGDPKAALKYTKQKVAEGVALATKRSRKDIGNSIAVEMKKSGIEADLGTLTNSNLVKIIQTQLEHSGLVGGDLEKLRTRITNQFETAYSKIANELGDYKYKTIEEAGQAMLDASKETLNHKENFLKRISQSPFVSDIAGGKELKSVLNDLKTPKVEEFNKKYKNIRSRVGKISATQTKLANQLNKFIDENSRSFLKSEAPAEQKVLRSAEKLLGELVESPQLEKGAAAKAKRFGAPSKYPKRVQDQIDKALLKASKPSKKAVTLSELWATKTSLGEIANWEFGGSNFESKYKYLVKLVDDAIEATLAKQNPKLAKKFKNLNKEYSKFKDIFENKHVIKFFEKNNKNFGSNYRGVLTDDGVKALNRILDENLFSNATMDKVKRDYAAKFLKKTHLTDRDLGNLESAIGHSFSLKEIGIKSDKKKNKLIKFISEQTPEKIFNKMNSVSGIKELENLAKGIEGGKQIVDNLKRLKLEKMVGDNMVDSATHQIKAGTFSKLLEKGQNRAIVKHMLGEKAYKDLVYLQKHAGEIAASGNKFLNTSRTHTSRRDYGALITILTGVFTWNPWLVMEVGGAIAGFKKGAALMADKEFLEMTREAIIANKRNDLELLEKSWTGMMQKFKENQKQIQQATGAAIVNQ